MSALEKLPKADQAVVRHRVRDLLQRSEAFAALPAQERRRVARGVVDVVAFLADPAGAVDADRPLGDADVLGARHGLARSRAETNEEAKKETGVEKLQKRLAGKQDFAGKDFDAGAMRAGTQAFKELVGAVDFPAFVSGQIGRAHV